VSTQKPPLLADATRDLARFGAALQYANIPADVIARIKLSLLDSLGCCLFGATLPWTQKVAELADAEAAKPAATLIGLGRKATPLNSTTSTRNPSSMPARSPRRWRWAWAKPAEKPRAATC